MKRVFLDTNILIDYIQARAGGNDAKQLLMRGRDGEVTLCASFLTFANMAYILDGKADVYEFFAMLTGFITVLPMDSDQLQAALARRAKDFEDMLQYQCAMALAARVACRRVEVAPTAGVQQLRRRGGRDYPYL